MAKGDMIWFEIWTEDPERAQDFYGSLFGWSFEPFAEYVPDNYWIIQKESKMGTNGALVRRTAEQRTAPGRSTINYLWVDDLQAATQLALEKGGALEEDAKKIGSVDGSFSIVVDPDGNRIGLWAP